MDRSNLPQPPAGCSWKPGVGGLPMLYGRYQLPDGRKVERSTQTTSVPVARRRYCRMMRDIAAAYADGTLDKLLGTRGTRSDKGKKRAKSAAAAPSAAKPVKQVKESET